MIAFGRAICGDLEQAERREWLVTNGLGGFASGTIAGTLTRRYHGLLIAAVHPPADRRLLATKIEESIVYRNTAYELGANRWNGGYISPRGFELIERFALDGTEPVWHYALADALLEKRIWMEHGANATWIRYRLLRSRGPLAMTLRVFVNDRDFHGNTHGLTHGMPVSAQGGSLLVGPLTVSASNATVCVENIWYRDYVLLEETRRGLDDRDDNLCAGTLAVTLRPGEDVSVRACGGTSAGDATRHRREVLDAWERTPHACGAPTWMRQCVLAADQFVVARPAAGDPDGRSIIAGYHWFSDWGRDTMIALPGLTLVTGRPDIARRVLRTWAPFVDRGLLPNAFPAGGQAAEYNSIDAPLWYVEAAARYLEATGDLETLRALWPSLESVIRAYRDGTRYGIRMDADGLVTGGRPGLQLTWMDAKVGDWVVSPRIGKPVEIGALWYNALVRMSEFAQRLGLSSEEYERLARLARTGFARFWNEDASCCYDVLDGPNGNDPTLRPNQIIAVSLGHCALPPERMRAVVDACAASFVTSNGLRTLAPDDPRFVAHYGGTQAQRDAAYHEGTAWPWLLGHFALAHARVYRDSAAARSFLEPLADQLFDCGLGSISEIADAAAPFTPRGAIAQAWSVAELIRAWCDIPAATG
jgi:predicted glycogen debranching enzyme